MPKLDARWLTEQANAIGIPLIGVTDASPLTDFLPRLKKRLRENPDGVPFVRNKPEARIDFRATMPAAESVIVIGVPCALYPAGKPKKGQGTIASVAIGTDYHARVRERCDALMAAMTAAFGAAEERAYVDNSRLVDKGAAWRAGLGFFGKNNLLINEQYGSAFNIGVILTARRIDFTPASPMPCRCGACTACLDACPTGALGDGFALDYHRCLSNLTQQKKLTEAEAARLATFLYGCDICQWVCPYNRRHAEAATAQAHYDLDTIIAMSDEEFTEIFGDSALAWRGAATLRRNARLLKENNP